MGGYRIISFYENLIKIFLHLDHLQDYKLECAKETFQGDYIQRRFLDVKRQTVEVNLEKILEEHDGIIIYAEAGMGKSVTAKRIKYEWGTEQILKDFHLMYFNSKQINQHLRIRSNAAPLFFSQIGNLLKKKSKTIEDFVTYDCVKATISNLIIIIDGIDELPIKELINASYISELEKKIINNEEISATDTIVAIYFGYFFPFSKVCLFGRAGEFERLKSVKDHPNSSIFNKKNRKELELLSFKSSNVNDFICIKICKQLNGQTGCSNSCQDIYEKIKDIELAKVPTDLNSLIEIHKKHPDENIGRITKTKLFIATLFNRLSEHATQKNISVNKTFSDLLNSNSKLVEGIRVIAKISFNSLLEGDINVKVKEVKKGNSIYIKYKDETLIERDTLEQLDFFYIRDFVYYHLLEPYHLTNIEFLAACYLFSNSDQLELLLKLNTDRKTIILSYLAGLHADDHLTRDFVTIVVNTSNYCINDFFNWLFNIKNSRESLPNGHDRWYGILDNQKMSPSFYLLNSIHCEIEIPKPFIPETIVCYSKYSSSFEWYDMKYFKHNFLIDQNSINQFDIESFLDNFACYKFLVIGNIDMKNIKLYDHDRITFKINHLDIQTPLTNINTHIKSNSLSIWNYDSHTMDMVLRALSPLSTTNTFTIKRLNISCIFEFNELQTEQIFELCLTGVDVIALRLSFFKLKQIEQLKTIEDRNVYKRINLELAKLDFNDMFALPSLGTRHICLRYIKNVNNEHLVRLKTHLVSNEQHHNNLDRYKIIDSLIPFISKNKSSAESEQQFYLHLYNVNFNQVSSNVFAQTVSCISTLVCEDKDDFIPSSHWKELSRCEKCHINELRVWYPKLNNLEYFIKANAKTLQLICNNKDQLKELLDYISKRGYAELDKDKEIQVFVVKCDENNWDYYEEIVIFSLNIKDYGSNSNTYISHLDDITVPYHEGEQHLKWWCCEIGPVEEMKVNEISVIDNKDNENCSFLKKCLCCVLKK